MAKYLIEIGFHQANDEEADLIADALIDGIDYMDTVTITFDTTEAK